MIVKHKFRYEVGDLICLPNGGSFDNYDTVVIVEGETEPEFGYMSFYTVFDFSINDYRRIGVGSYMDINSQRLT